MGSMVETPSSAQIPYYQLEPNGSIMSYVIPTLLVTGTIIFMECFAAWSHEHIMHGWGWAWHKSHHEPHDESLEKNDLYGVVFAAFSIFLFWFGARYFLPVWWMALGISIYGVLYFFVHDGLVHQRWPFKYVPRRGYLKRVYQAHRMHHAVEGRDGCVSFGFVYAEPVENLKLKLRKRQEAKAVAKDLHELDSEI
jgi:beta-carotene 3-hydroxylase